MSDERKSIEINVMLLKLLFFWKYDEAVSAWLSQADSANSCVGKTHLLSVDTQTMRRDSVN